MREWFTSTVAIMAREMRRSGDFSALPILADAMQDAGFDDINILNSMRNDPKAGNWVIAFVLEEQEASKKWMEEFATKINNSDRWDDEAPNYEHNLMSYDKLLKIAKEGMEHYSMHWWSGGHPPEICNDDKNVMEFWRHAEILLKATVSDHERQVFECDC